MKKKSIIILFIIISIINVLMPMNIQATEVNELPESSDIAEGTEKSKDNNNSIFSEDITFTSEYIPGDGDIMPHGLITPSTASTSSSVPLIVWLHGSGEFGGGEDLCMGKNNPNLLPRVLMESSLEKFHAYILIPHSAGTEWYSNSWMTEKSIKNVSTLIKNFVEEKKNVDTNNIVIAGHSMGAQGSLYMTIKMDQMPYTFSKLVIVSGYEIHGSENITIPTRIYYGYGDNQKLNIPIAEPSIPVSTGHPGAAKAAYNLDKDRNNRSDLIEWLFGDYNIETGGGVSLVTREGETGGGSLLKPISQFLCYIFDAIIDFLQDMFVTPERIKLEDGIYSIKYSPGIIFSGQVPALDINFIKPGEGKTASVTRTEYISLLESLDMNGAKKIYEQQYAGLGFEYVFVTKKGIIRDIKKDEQYEYDETREIDIELLEGKLQSIESENPQFSFAGSYWDSEANTFECAWYNEDETQMYILVDYYKITQNTDMSGVSTNTNRGLIYLYKLDTNKDLDDVTDITGEEGQKIVYTKEYASSAAILQNIIATWYNALKRIALVGLLSAIVYIGIRIVLTSTSAKDKAKYKAMLKDWIIALCLLFTLHYIMSVTITVVGKINEVVKASSIAANGEDILMTNVRNSILNGNNWSEVLTYVVIYSVLAVYTIIYTIQYVRRLIYLAFLTVIAPLITLTYPLDKIKDSKSQAFDMWIKDYIFFSLIQVVHLLIYYIFLGSAIDLNKSGNWLYAIVAIGFIVPAEKLIKKMFGFEKSKTLGAMAAGATGALVMNAIQKIPHSNSKGGTTTKQETPKTVRTAGGQSMGDFVRQSLLSESIRTKPLSEANVEKENGENINISAQESKLAQKLKDSQMEQNSVAGKLKKPQRNTVNGVKKVVGKYVPPVATSTIRLMTQTTGALIGASAIIAQGELENIGTGIVVGAGAGKQVANMTVDGVKKASQIPEKLNEVVETWKEGAHENEENQDKESIQKNKFDKVFRNTREYNDLRRDSGLSRAEFDKRVQIMVDSGIKNTKQMNKILKNNRKHPRKYTMEKAIKYSKLAEECTMDVLDDKVKFIRFCQDRKLNLTEEELIELKKDIMNFK